MSSGSGGAAALPAAPENKMGCGLRAVAAARWMWQGRARRGDGACAERWSFVNVLWRLEESLNQNLYC